MKDERVIEHNRPARRIYAVFTLGTKLRADGRTIARLLTHPEVVVFVLLVVGVLAALNPMELTTRQPIYLQLAIWLGAVSVFMLALYLFAVILERVLGRLRHVRIYTPLALFTALLISESFNYWFHFIILKLSAADYPGLLIRALSQLPIILIFEVIFIRFVMAHIMDLNEGAREWNWKAAPAAATATIVASPPRNSAPVNLGGQSFPPEAIMLIRAQEHYITVRTDQRDIMLRENISRAVDKLPDPLGMRVHRSYWVSFAYARMVQRQGPGKYGLLLSDGQSIPLSRAIKPDFEDRLRQAEARRALAAEANGSLPEPHQSTGT